MLCCCLTLNNLSWKINNQVFFFFFSSFKHIFCLFLFLFLSFYFFSFFLSLSLSLWVNRNSLLYLLNTPLFSLFRRFAVSLMKKKSRENKSGILGKSFSPFFFHIYHAVIWASIIKCPTKKYFFAVKLCLIWFICLGT